MFKLRAIVVGSVLLGCQGAKHESDAELHAENKPSFVSAQRPVILNRTSKAQPTEPTASQHKLLLLSRESDSLLITAERTVDGPLNPHPRRVGHRAWSFDALDAQGTVLHRDNLVQPGFVRGEFKNSDGLANSPPDHVEVERDGPHSLQIRVPLNTHHVNFYVGNVEHRDGRVLNTLSLGDEVRR